MASDGQGDSWDPARFSEGLPGDAWTLGAAACIHCGPAGWMGEGKSEQRAPSTHTQKRTRNRHRRLFHQPVSQSQGSDYRANQAPSPPSGRTQAPLGKEGAGREGTPQGTSQPPPLGRPCHPPATPSCLPMACGPGLGQRVSWKQGPESAALNLTRPGVCGLGSGVQDQGGPFGSGRGTRPVLQRLLVAVCTWGRGAGPLPMGRSPARSPQPRLTLLTPNAPPRAPSLGTG